VLSALTLGMPFWRARNNPFLFAHATPNLVGRWTVGADDVKHRKEKPPKAFVV